MSDVKVTASQANKSGDLHNYDLQHPDDLPRMVKFSWAEEPVDVNDSCRFCTWLINSPCEGISNVYAACVANENKEQDGCEAIFAELRHCIADNYEFLDNRSAELQKGYSKGVDESELE